MSRFNTVLENNLNKTNLVRIRIKHDPKNEADVRGDYVGYVLEEDGDGNVIAIVPSLGGDRMELGSDDYDIELTSCDSEKDHLTDLKKHVVDFLMIRGYHDKVSSAMDIIINASNVKQLESVVQSCDGDSMLLSMYREFFER